MTETAIVLANGRLRTIHAKTAHGLIRGPSRFRILAVVDPTCAGVDAGAALDGVPRGIPVIASVQEWLERRSARPDALVVGVATGGGVLPDDLRSDLLEGARAGLRLVNGLHQGLAEDAELAAAVARSGGSILDLRRPRARAELRFWTGEVLSLVVPRVAVLGMDCAIGKRTTTVRLLAACDAVGIRAQVVATGQTGWLQGFDHGFLLDATPNDFVCGELERAVLSAARDGDPQIILIEGQSSLRNPSGPCGAELLLAAGAKHVVLQHAPGRRFFDGLEHLGLRVGSVEDEVALIRAYGAEVVAVTLHSEAMSGREIAGYGEALESALGLPVVRPLEQDIDRVVEALRPLIA